MKRLIKRTIQGSLPSILFFLESKFKVLSLSNLVFRCCCLTLLFALCIGCSVGYKLSNSGIVISRSYTYDLALKAYKYTQVDDPDTKVWYKDSIVIQERFSVYTTQVNGRIKEREVDTKGFTYIDLPTRSFYHYNSFSDTAKLTAKWTQPDSTPFNDYGGGVWNFYASRSIRLSQPPIPLPDTVMDGTHYKRVKFMQEFNNHVLPSIGYFRCDKRGTMFQYFKATSEKVGCPLTRYENIPTEENPRAFAGEVLFVANTLTPLELKVFAAWEKNAKANPVHR